MTQFFRFIMFVVLLAASPAIQAQEIRAIPFLPDSEEAAECFDVSGDGSTVLGICLMDSWEPYLYRLEADELIEVGTLFGSATSASGITYDGTVIVGSAGSAFLWNEEDDFDLLDGCDSSLY